MTKINPFCAVPFLCVLLSNLAGADTASSPLNPVPPGLTLQELVMISSDRNAEISRLSVAVDSSDRPQGVQLWTHLLPTGQATVATKKLVYPVHAIESKDGVILDKEGSHVAIILKGTISEHSVSDLLTLEYLSNGLWNTYDSCETVLEKSADSPEWKLLNRATKLPVKSIFVKSWSLGITTLEGICDSGG
jgi:hypothetical protein